MQDQHGGVFHAHFEILGEVIGVEDAVLVEERVELQFVLDERLELFGQLLAILFGMAEEDSHRLGDRAIGHLVVHRVAVAEQPTQIMQQPNQQPLLLLRERQAAVQREKILRPQVAVQSERGTRQLHRQDAMGLSGVAHRGGKQLPRVLPPTIIARQHHRVIDEQQDDGVPSLLERYRLRHRVARCRRPQIHRNPHSARQRLLGVPRQLVRHKRRELLTGREVGMPDHVDNEFGAIGGLVSHV